MFILTKVDFINCDRAPKAARKAGGSNKQRRDREGLATLPTAAVRLRARYCAITPN